MAAKTTSKSTSKSTSKFWLMRVVPKCTNKKYDVLKENKGVPKENKEFHYFLLFVHPSFLLVRRVFVWGDPLGAHPDHLGSIRITLDYLGASRKVVPRTCFVLGCLGRPKRPTSLPNRPQNRSKIVGGGSLHRTSLRQITIMDPCLVDFSYF